MITRMLITAAVLIAAYAAGINAVPPDLLRRGFGQKDNPVKVENVLYREAAPTVMLVGSSIAALLYSDMLPADWGNLSIGAGSSLTGLEIIERSKLKPRAVIVEVNMLMRSTDEDLLKIVYAEPIHSIRNSLPVFRLQNHPTTLLFSLIERGKGDGVNLRNDTKYRLGISYHADAFHNPLPRPVMRSRIEALKQLVRSLGRRGIAFYFVRYPLDPQIAEMPQVVDVLKAVRASFASAHSKWIEVPPDSEFTTTDGIHLETSGARRMAQVLVAGLAELEKKREKR